MWYSVLRVGVHATETRFDAENVPSDDMIDSSFSVPESLKSPKKYARWSPVFRYLETTTISFPVVGVDSKLSQQAIDISPPTSSPV